MIKYKVIYKQLKQTCPTGYTLGSGLYFPFFTPGKQPYFEISEMTTHTPMNRARDI
jgi:hypothetical protein